MGLTAGTRAAVKWGVAAVCFASLALDLWRIGGDWSWLMIPAALVGWYVSDLNSGLVHMYMDYRPSKPGTGLRELYFWQGSTGSRAYRRLEREVYGRISPLERVAYDFKKHHPMPDLVARNGVLDLMWLPMLIVLPVALAYNALFLLTDMPGWFIVGVVTTLTGSIFTQYFHGTMHRDERAPTVRLMRGLGLLMKPEAHTHHHAVLTRDFAVISGWSNPLVNLCAHTLLRLGVMRKEGLEPS